jgi:hypothetical protein
MRTRNLEPEFSDADWVERVCTALLRLDSASSVPEAYAVALELNALQRWRMMPPGEAALKFVRHPEAADGA